MNLEAKELLTQSPDHILAMADVVSDVATRGIEWAEEYINVNTIRVDFVEFRTAVYEAACQVYDGEDGCVLDCNDCELTEYEAEVLITTFAMAAFQFMQTHAVFVVEIPV